MNRLLKRTGLMVVTLAVYSAVASPVAFAGYTTAGWVGVNAHSSVQVRGVSANIYTPANPTVSSSDTYASSSAWVMDHNDGVSNGAYAQVGFYFPAGRTQPYYFFEEADTSGNVVDILTNGNVVSDPTTHSYTNAVGPQADYNYPTGHSYKVWEDSSDIWHGSVDGAFSSTFDVYDASWIGTDAQYIDEVHDYNYAQYYGDTSDPVRFSDLQWMDGSNAWHYTTGTVDNNDPSGYGRNSGITNNSSATSYFTTWDSRY